MLRVSQLSQIGHCCSQSCSNLQTPEKKSRDINEIHSVEKLIQSREEISYFPVRQISNL